MEFLRSAKVIALLTLLSRVLGLVRDMLTTAVLSAGVCDALILAWTLPNVFRNLFGEGALSTAFIPVFSRVMLQEGKERAYGVARRVITFVGLLLLILVVVLVALTYLVPREWLLPAFGQSELKLDATLRLARILLPYLMIVCVIAQAQALLNSLREFFLPALSPVLVNAAWIAAAATAGFLVDLSDPDRALLIASGIMGGAALQVVLFSFALRRHRFPLRASLHFKDPDFRRVMTLTLPMILGVSAAQINVLVDQWVVSAFVPRVGGVSNLFVGNRLMQFPLGLVGVALSTALFPLLARMAAAGDQEGIKTNLQGALRINYFLTVPSAVGLWLLAVPILTLLFQRMAFTPERVEAAAGALKGYAAGIPFLITSMLLTRVFYAMERWRQPVTISLTLMGVNLALDLALVGPFAEAGVALSTTLVAMIQSLLLFLLLRRSIGRLGGRGLAGALLKILLLAGALGAIVALCGWITGVGEGAAGSLLERSVRVFVPLLAGGGAYLLCARRLCPFEWSTLMESLARRRRSAA